MNKRTLPVGITLSLKNSLNELIKTLDYLKDLNEFNSLDKDIIMRLSLIRTLSSQVVEKLY